MQFAWLLPEVMAHEQVEFIRNIESGIRGILRTLPVKDF
jgi:hypothetical protein